MPNIAGCSQPRQQAERLRAMRGVVTNKFAGCMPARPPCIQCAFAQLTRAPDSLSDSLSQRPIYNEIGAGNSTGCGTREEHHAGGYLLCRSHAAGWIGGNSRLEKIGHSALDVLPDAAFEVGVARRDRVYSDTLSD